MPQLLKENFNGGLVTSRDPSTLLPGELQQAQDCIYRPADLAIHRAPGRTAYGTVFSSSISVTTDSDTTISSTGAFGTDVASSVVTDGSDLVTKATGGGLELVTVGQSLWGTGIPAGAIILELTNDGSNDVIRLDKAGTATGTVTVTHSNYHVSDTIDHTDMASGTTLVSIQNASNATITPAATGSSTDATTIFTRRVKGLSYLNFEENDDLLIAYSGTTLYSSGYTGATGSWSALVSGLLHDGGETLDVIHFRERYLALTGVNANQVINYANGDPPTVQVRSHGMAPVVDYTSAALGLNTWSSLLGNGVWWFLVTEVLNPGGDDSADLNQDNAETIESAYTGEAKDVEITAFASQSVVITKGLVYNDGTKGLNTATHWRVYMSPRQETNEERPSISTFTLIATVPIGDTTVDLQDDNTATTSSTSGGQANATSPGWTSIANLATVNASVASSSIDSGVVDTFDYGFSVAGIADKTISGIKVEVFGLKIPYSSNARFVDVQLIKDYGQGGVEYSSKRRLDMRGNDVWYTMIAGSQYDGWDMAAAWDAGTNDNDSDFEDVGHGGTGTVFGIRLTKPDTAADETVHIDGIRVTVYAGGTTINANGKSYDIVVLDDGLGNLIPFPANMPPPISDTGDVFQGQAVLNDVDSPADIVYSIPDKLDAFPSLYRVTFESKMSDKVRMIRRLGTHLIVGLRSSIKRVNFLPSMLDAKFKSSESFYDVSTNVGVVGPHAATMFDMPGAGPLMALVSYNGLHLTDGITTRPLNEDLAWVDTVSESELDTAVLINDPKNYMLIMYYTPTGGAAHSKAIYFYYHPIHIKQGGRLPATGPITVSAAAATPALLAGIPKVLTGHNSDSKVYLEDNGTSDASGGSINPVIRTRLVYPFEVGGQAKMERIWVRGSATDGDFTVASCTTTADSTAVSSSAGFGSVIVGTMVTGTGIDPGTYIITVTDSSNIVLSRAANASGTVTLTFHNGVVHATIRFQNIDEAVSSGNTAIFDTDKAALQVAHTEAFGEAFEVKFEKPTAINNAMRLHYWAALIEGHGLESNQTGGQ